MPTSERQKTLKGPFTRSGRGLHTGKTVVLKALPAPDRYLADGVLVAHLR